jgi:hypothetical protein
MPQFPANQYLAMGTLPLLHHTFFSDHTWRTLGWLAVTVSNCPEQGQNNVLENFIYDDTDQQSDHHFFHNDIVPGLRNVVFLGLGDF